MKDPRTTGGGGRGRGRPPGPQAETDRPPTDGLGAWLEGRLPDGWFEGPPTVTVDRDEITVVGRITVPETDGDPVDREAAEAGRISRFREETREERMAVARETEHRYGRTVSWGAEAGGTRRLFTHLSVPVMTRLRQPERLVLDTLVDSGVARSRSDALAWCVRLVAEHTGEWLADLRSAMEAVEDVRRQGPGLGGA